MEIRSIIAIHMTLITCGWLVDVAHTHESQSKTNSNTRPNFIVFFADDIGWGDMGANWAPNEKVTPNLNKMAERGVRLTDFHVGASVCAPSRAALLTGRLGLRTGLVSNFSPGSIGGLPVNETTIAEVLQSNGYHTGMIGKWHLGTTGQFHPISRGFEYYYGLPYSNDMGCVDVPVFNHPPCEPCPKNPPHVDNGICRNANTAVPLYENGQIVEQPVDLNQLGDHYASKAEKFLSRMAMDTSPFFLYVAFAHMHAPLSHAPRFTNSTPLNTVYSDTLHEMDDVMGRILGALRRHGMEENTMVWFTGDNGPWLAKCELAGSPGPFVGTWLTKTYGGGSTAKCTTWEGGHREPAVVVWPGHIPPNTTSDALTSALDIFPTIVKLSNAEMPQRRRYDGMDISEVLEGRVTQAHQVLYHPNSGVTPKIGEIDTIRLGGYKAFWKTGGSNGCAKSCDGRVAPLVTHDPPIIFDVKNDPAESKLVTADTDPNYEKVLKFALQLRESIYADIKTDNTSKPDYRKEAWAYPCCDPTQFLCRCQRDGRLKEETGWYGKNL